MSACHVSVEVDAGEVVRQLDDDELAMFGLVKSASGEIVAHHEALFYAVERGDCAGAARAAEAIAWAMYGRILTGRVAA